MDDNGSVEITNIYNPSSMKKIMQFFLGYNDRDDGIVI